MEKIDIHCHTTNRKVFDVRPKSASLDAIVKEMKKYDIEKTVVLATYFPHKDSGVSNFRMYDWIRENEYFWMFGSLDFKNYFYQGINELNEMADRRMIKGIKIYTSYQEVDLKSKKFKEVVKLAKKYSLPMMFHCGYSYTSMKKYGKSAITDEIKASDVEFVADQGVDVIVSHMAKPHTDDLIEVVKRNKKTYTDMSGVFDSKYVNNKPDFVEDIKKFLGECGPLRLLFGTDFPVQTHEDSIYLIEEAMKDYPDKDKQLVYYDNAWRLLK